MSTIDWTQGEFGWTARVPYLSNGAEGFYVIHIEPRPRYCDRGDWLFHLEVEYVKYNFSPLDGQDGFPRYFFGDEAEAKEQMTRWVRKRAECRAAAAKAMA